MWLVNQKESEQKEREIKNNEILPSPKVNKTAISVYPVIISSHVNGLNTPINRHRVAEWIHKQYLYIHMPPRDSPQV